MEKPDSLHDATAWFQSVLRANYLPEIGKDELKDLLLEKYPKGNPLSRAAWRRRRWTELREASEKFFGWIIGRPLSTYEREGTCENFSRILSHGLREFGLDTKWARELFGQMVGGWVDTPPEVSPWIRAEALKARSPVFAVSTYVVEDRRARLAEAHVHVWLVYHRILRMSHAQIASRFGESRVNVQLSIRALERRLKLPEFPSR